MELEEVEVILLGVGAQLLFADTPNIWISILLFPSSHQARKILFLK